MASSANRVRISCPGELCDRIAARRERSAVLRRNQAGSLSPVKALDGQFSQAGEETALRGVNNNADGTERVHDMHPSVLVNAYECDALQAGDRHPPQQNMRKEGVQFPARAFLRRAGQTVLADGPGMRREDCSQLG